jgi:hypothetical protein
VRLTRRRFLTGVSAAAEKRVPLDEHDTTEFTPVRL